MKGICFIEPLFHAVIEGIKTQTRRIINPQPNFFEECKPFCYSDFTIKAKRKVNEDLEHWFEIYPRYKVGEKIYLKEPYVAGTRGLILYKYPPCKMTSEYDREMNNLIGKKWQNKLFMPTKYARYFIEINCVRCERLQDISYEDCFSEGMIQQFDDYQNALSIFGFDENPYMGETPQQAYAALIDKINGKGTWESNPYVFVYDFKLINKSFDEILDNNKDVLHRLKYN
jgi:hypothetical protein